MIQNIVFDMGNVMLQFRPILYCRQLFPVDEAAAQALCAQVVGTPEWLSMDAGIHTEEEITPLVESRIADERLRARVAPLLADWDKHSFLPMPGMGEMVRKLKSAGYGVFLLSNASARLRSYAHLIPSIELFDGLMVSAEEKMMKPDTRLYLRLCEKFSLAPESCLFVDDMPANCEGARTAGMSAVQFTDEPALRAFLKAQKILPA